VVRNLGAGGRRQEAVGPVVATQGGPTGVAVDDTGSVWVLNQFEGTLVRSGPARIKDDVEVGVGANDLAVGEGGVRVTKRSRTLIAAHRSGVDRPTQPDVGWQSL
jgi:hypothetical protein